MNAKEAIARLSSALALLSQQEYNKEIIRTLTKEVSDEKHWHYIEQGLATNDKSSIMHGVMGALSHYEAEKERDIFQKRVQSVAKKH